MTDRRPDPDKLLEQLKTEEARARRGKLKIFFGATAGVGKTYAMLSTGRQMRLQGNDVVIGIVETHGRKETAALLDGLEQLPLRDIVYKDRVLREFDLDGALARRPALILVDELAHSNTPGARHPKRWQDVEELLAAGIDVYTTLNVQHLETLNDIVGGITGIRVWETVADRIFDQADEVVLVDLPPDELLQRLTAGKVYLPQQADRAVQNFFRKGNLIALRELALRRTADRVDSEMQRYRHDQSVSSVWQIRESLLVCVGPGAGGEKMVRSAARIAGRMDVPWHAIYVETPELQRLPEARRSRVLRTLKLALELGAETSALAGADPAETVVQYARSHNLYRILVGRGAPRRWCPWHRSFADRIGLLAPDLDVTQIARADVDERPRPADRADDAAGRLKTPWQYYARSIAACAVATLVTLPFYSRIDLANVSMVFLLAVVLIAVRYGRGPALLAAFLSVAAFDFFFVPPRFSFSVTDVQYLPTFLVMLLVGLLTGQMTAGLRYQARVATHRESRMRALYEMARDLSGALVPEQIAEICDRFAGIAFGAKAVIFVSDLQDRLQPPIAVGDNRPEIDQAVAQWVFDHEAEAGSGTDTLPASSSLYVPLKAPMRTRGVLAIEPRNARRLMIPEQRRLLDTFARLIAIALERVHYVDIARSTTVQIESERLQNALLSALSQDLRDPLAALAELAGSVANPPALEDAGARLRTAAAVRDEALRIHDSVSNLLDLARVRTVDPRIDRTGGDQGTPSPLR